MAGRLITAGTRVIPRVEERAVPLVSLKRLILQRFMRHRLAVAGLVSIGFMVLFAFVGPFLIPYSPDAINLRERFAKPSFVRLPGEPGTPSLYNFEAIQAAALTNEGSLTLGHLLGTDDLGRDTATRAMFGGRVSLGIGFLVSLISVTMGVTVGCISGFMGGWWDNVIMRLNDVENTLPDLPILMVLSKIFPPGFWTMCLILVALSAFRGVRIARAMTLSLKGQAFSEAAQSLGAGWPRMISRHILPNSLSPLMVTVTLAAGGAIRAETSLSYLGLGIQPPMPSWGNMLSNAQQYFFSAPWLVFFPGVCIFITLMSFNLIGDGLRDAFDPRMTRR
jgi:peptide/nickel transport system permease protein